VTRPKLITSTPLYPEPVHYCSWRSIMLLITLTYKYEVNWDHQASTDDIEFVLRSLESKFWTGAILDNLDPEMGRLTGNQMIDLAAGQDRNDPVYSRTMLDLRDDIRSIVKESQ